jgi:hypothetical protein
MKARIASFLLMGAVFLAGASPANGYPVTIYIEAVVDTVQDSGNYLEGKISAGNLITGYYTYESTTPDSEPSVYDGIYEHTSIPYGMSLTAGGMTFQTNPANVNLIIGLTNNYYGEPWDYYRVTSYNNLVLDNGVSVDQLHWQLDDYPGTVLSNDALPTTPLDLSQWQTNSLSISGGIYPFPPEGDKTLFLIRGHVDSVYLIPEPATIILFGIGGLFLRKRR